jgi:hypothetical protein
MPVARPQNTQAKPRKGIQIDRDDSSSLMRAGREYLEFKISRLSYVGHDVGRQRGPPHLLQDDLAIVLKQLQHHLGPT